MAGRFAAMVNVGSMLGQLATRAGVEGMSAAILLRTGAVGLDPPHRMYHAFQALRQLGPAGAAFELARQQHPDRLGIIDDFGSLTFAELDRRSSALAVALAERGFRDGDSVGVLCRNHRGMLDALAATAKLGARTLLLNTDFSGPQLADVCEREDVSMLLADAEFDPVLDGIVPRNGRYRTLALQPGLAPNGSADPVHENVPSDDVPSTEQLIEDQLGARPARPRRAQQIVLLTSGTTGSPKGAPREFGVSLAIPGGYLSRIPLRSARNVLVAAPIFHAWGLLSTMLAIGLGNTVVTHSRFDPHRTLQALAEHNCDALISVPILLSRLLDTGDETAPPTPLPALRIVAVSGSALSPELAARTTAALGDVLYNLYGSTEVAYAAIATPADLKAAPGTVGRAPLGTILRVLGDDGTPVARGETGRIFVSNLIQFSGYTGGGTKEQIDGLMATGDLGHFDAAGRLFVDGRDDDMIISGGENVFPTEIENLLTGHPGVAEAAVVGVPDPEFGQRLRAYIVRAGNGPQADALDEDQVRQYVKENLARYKVPREVVFVPALPRNPAGKVVKRDLPDA